MQTEITLQALIQCGLLIMGVWGFYKIVMEIVKAITTRHDREQEWDNSAKQIKEEHAKITDKYDKEIMDIRELIDATHCDTEAKIQEVRAELEILTRCMQATLDGLHQLGANGNVTETKKMLDAYLVEKAHE